MPVQRYTLFPVGHSKEEKQKYVDPSNPDSPFYGFIGNDKAIKRLSRAAFVALGNKFHYVMQNFALLGPASTGKTTLAKKFAYVLRVPFVEIHPRSVSGLNDILVKIAGVCQDFELPDGSTLELQPLEARGSKNLNYIKLPVMVILLDEVHALSKNIVQGLLKATEPKDACFHDEKGYIVDCSQVCWMIATTDRGKLFDAFDTRFSKIQLEMYSKAQIAQIVKLNYPDLPDEACELIAKFGGKIPREVLSFATDCIIASEIESGNWEEIIRSVAEDHNIDEHGMSYQTIDILKALKKNPISKNRMSDVVKCKYEELENFVMPALLEDTPDQPALVKVTTKGYDITKTGLQELERRGL